MRYFDIVAMNCTVYIVNCNFTIHATFLLTFMAYKYNEFQMSSAIQKLGFKGSCEKNKNVIMWKGKHA